jgi:hypothetical protein
MTNKTIIDDIFINTVPTATSTQKDVAKNENSWEISEDLISKHSSPADIKAASLEFDELPNDQEFNKQSASHAITSILEPSNQLKNAIHEYLDSHDVKTIPLNEFTHFNTFSINNQKYLLDSEDTLQDIYKIILNFESTKVQTKILKQQRSLKGLLKELPPEAQQFNNQVLQKLNYDIVIKLLKRTLSTILLNILKSERNYTLSKNKSVHKNTVCSIIGEAMFDTYTKMNHIYEDTTKYEP